MLRFSISSVQAKVVTAAFLLATSAELWQLTAQLPTTPLMLLPPLKQPPLT